MLCLTAFQYLLQLFFSYCKELFATQYMQLLAHGSTCFIHVAQACVAAALQSSHTRAVMLWRSAHRGFTAICIVKCSCTCSARCTFPGIACWL